jgi:hypothetical protein
MVIPVLAARSDADDVTTDAVPNEPFLSFLT